MSNIEQPTDASRYTSRTIIGEPQVPSIISFLVEKGLVKNPRKAGIILVCIIIFNFVSILTLLTLHITGVF